MSKYNYFILLLLKNFKRSQGGSCPPLAPPVDTDIDLFGLFSRDCVECSIEDTEMWASYVDVGRLELYE